MPDGLLGLATALVAIPSVSHHEAALADAVEAALALCPWLAVERVGDNVMARTELDRGVRVVLAGHLDTVPPVGGNEEPRIEDQVLFGVGAADMKGGLAVFLHLAGSVPEPAVDVTWCFYVCEEVEQEFNGLRSLWEERPDLLRADAAILGEPTGGVVEAGCQGTMRVRLSLAGRRAHTARPTSGRNAIHRLGPGADGGGRLRESAARCSTGASTSSSCRSWRCRAGWPPNVVPDEASVLINHRFAPGPDHRGGRVVGTRSCCSPTWRRGTGGSWSSSRRLPHLPSTIPCWPSLVAATGDRAEGQAGLDRCGFLLGARHPGGQLRPWRSAAGPHAG